MITLYGHPYSHNARKVHWALEELATPYEYATVDLMGGGHKTADFLEMNPNGRVPVIHDGPLVLYESNAILWYLAEKSRALLPSDFAGRATVLQWLAWQASDVAATCLDPWLMRFYAGLGQPFDATKHAELVQRAKAPLAVLSGHLRGRRFVVGDTLSVADISIGESIGLCTDAGIDLEPHPAVRSWYAEIGQRPAFLATRPKA
jgi:glutathione S-transferase